MSNRGRTDIGYGYVIVDHVALFLCSVSIYVLSTSVYLGVC